MREETFVRIFLRGIYFLFDSIFFFVDYHYVDSMTAIEELVGKEASMSAQSLAITVDQEDARLKRAIIFVIIVHYLMIPSY